MDYFVEYTVLMRIILVLLLSTVFLCSAGCRRPDLNQPDGMAVSLQGPIQCSPQPPPELNELAWVTTPCQVDACVIRNLPTGHGEHWTNMADGCLASNGKFYTGIGNCLEFAGGLGQSRLYEYDPAARKLRTVADIRDVIGDPTIAAGKLHSRIDEGSDGWLYFTTYWGQDPEESDKPAFKGSALMRFDPRSGKCEYLGTPAPSQGLPSSRLDARRMILYTVMVPGNEFLAYDLRAGKVKYRGSGEILQGNRHVMLDASGKAYFSTTGGALAQYDPNANTVRITQAILPRTPALAKAGKTDSLRASAEPTADGMVYGITTAGELFAFDPANETVKDLGPDIGDGEYAVVLCASRDGKHLYYGLTSADGPGKYLCPIIQYETATGRRKLLVPLNLLLQAAPFMEYRASRLYNMRISQDGSTLLCTFNGAPVAAAGQKQEEFLQPAVVAIHIPESERR